MRKVAHQPHLNLRMREKIITPKAYAQGMAKMMHFIDAAKNHSKFYEMAVIPDDYGSYTLVRCYGALTDDIERIKILLVENLSLLEAKKQMEVKTREQLGKGYSDTFKTHRGAYPLGLDRKAPFDHGTQSAYQNKGAIQGLRAVLSDLDSAIEAGERMDTDRMSKALAEAARHLFDLPDSSMARQIEKSLAVPARHLLNGTAKASTLVRSLKVVRNKLALQFTEYDKNYPKMASGISNIPGKHIFDNAKVEGEAKVFHEAKVYDRAQVSDSAKVYGHAEVLGKAQVFENAKVSGHAKVSGNAVVKGDAKVFGFAEVYNDARVRGNAQVTDNAQVFGMAKVFGNATVRDNAQVLGNAEVYGNADVGGDAYIGGKAVILGGEWDGSEGPIMLGRWKGPGVPA